jgi:hypothetical protein
MGEVRTYIRYIHTYINIHTYIHTHTHIYTNSCTTLCDVRRGLKAVRRRYIPSHLEGNISGSCHSLLFLLQLADAFNPADYWFTPHALHLCQRSCHTFLNRGEEKCCGRDGVRDRWLKSTSISAVDHPYQSFLALCLCPSVFY